MKTIHQSPIFNFQFSIFNLMLLLIFFFVGINAEAKTIKIGVIGLDTSHSLEFVKAINGHQSPEFEDLQVVAAYPYGSKTIESSYSRIPKYIEEVQKYEVKITGSIKELLKLVDVVLLETNDGRLHLEQAQEVIKAGKPLFIDKPIANSYADAKKIFDLAQEKKVPVFSSSSLRFVKNVTLARKGELVGEVMGADTYSPATLEPTHTDLYWYGIHGVEMLFAVMGTGCQSVTRYYTHETDIVIGDWGNGKIGVFRGTRSGKSDFGGTVFGKKNVSALGKYEGYQPLLLEIAKFFKTGIPPVSPEETLEICAFIDAAQQSRELQGKTVRLF